MCKEKFSLLRVFDTGTLTAQENMKIDENLLSGLFLEKNPVLHFYRFINPSATYGIILNPKDWFRENLPLNFETAKRPTGGGIVFHLTDLAFSFLMPSTHPSFSINTLSNYEFVNSAVIRAYERFLGKRDFSLTKDDFETPEKMAKFCMAKPTKYDVIHQGKKIAGAAQRRTVHGYLHQGTISLALPSFDYLKEVLLEPDEIIESMKRYTFASIHENELEGARKKLEVLLAEELHLSLSRTADIL